MQDKLRTARNLITILINNNPAIVGSLIEVRSLIDATIRDLDAVTQNQPQSDRKVGGNDPFREPPR